MQAKYFPGTARLRQKARRAKAILLTTYGSGPIHDAAEALVARATGLASLEDTPLNSPLKPHCYTDEQKREAIPIEHLT